VTSPTRTPPMTTGARTLRSPVWLKLAESRRPPPERQEKPPMLIER
jgi:hypothetical protein